MLDAAEQHLALHRPELVRLAVDNERLHPAQHDADLLVRMAVERHDRGGLECLEVVETDELRVGHLAKAFRASGISTPWSADSEPGRGQLLCRTSTRTRP